MTTTKSQGNSLAERLLERASRQDGRKSQINRAAFLAVKDEIAEALAEGWSARQIWELLKEEGRISFGYAWFARCVQIHIHKRPPRSRISSGSATPTATPPSPVRTETPPVPSARPPEGIGATFVVRPTPSKKELIG
jgi:hypothetical protein